MKKILFLILYFTSSIALAHHTRDHLMLSEEADKVIAATREGATGDLQWLIWFGVCIALVLGLVRVWRGRHRS